MSETGKREGSGEGGKLEGEMGEGWRSEIEGGGSE